ncbi:MAG: bifunctional oligoribonuclease/PAP phosphatase NrnA [Lachnospiraceae bacterium]|nr:bifunctional oligoribonuclease/PAP phosphatase NrnA [Lachnospiraceae bacterium]
MNKLIEKIETSNTIAIFGHMNPDGDCIGSCLGLWNYIRDNYEEKEVVVYLQPLHDKFRFLKGADKVVSTQDDRIYDLGISLDCGDTDRHGEFGEIFKKSIYTICFDHHRSNQGFGDFFHCEPDSSSCCEVLFNFLDFDKISTECAEALYLGIVHDTGVFKYQATTEETMTIAGKLISKGARSQYIIDETFFKVSYNQNKLTGRALLDSKLFMDGKVIASCITKEIFDEYNTSKDDTDGIIDKLRVTDGVEVAILAYQKGEDLYKYSLRSVRYIDVSVIATAFGGGGHVRAAGFDAKGSFDDNLKLILDMIMEQMRKYN